MREREREREIIRERKKCIIEKERVYNREGKSV